MLTDALFLFSGAFVGLLSGALGIGGGVIIVPILLLIFHNTPLFPPELNIHLSIGTSLAIMIFTSQASLRAHFKHGQVLIHIYQRLAFGLGLGILTGGIAAFFIPSEGLKILLVVFLLSVALKMIFDTEAPRPQQFPNAFLNALVCFTVGLFSGLLGIGGSLLLLPYLTYCGIETRKITGILALCTMTVSIIGTVVYIITGLFASAPLPAWSTGYIYWPAVVLMAIPGIVTAPIGARLSYVLPVKQLRYAFIVLLIITAINLLPGGSHAGLPHH